MVFRKEGFFTRRVEKQTEKWPSLAFLGVAGAAMAGSIALFLTGRKQWGTLVGMWAPTILMTGVYNKLVKVH